MRPTKVVSVDRDRVCDEALAEAAEMLRNGEVVAFPTETVYGLGANALSKVAVSRIFEAKGRPSDNPLIVHIADRAQVTELAADVPENARRFMDAFWPGPLTIIFPKKPCVPDEVTAGLGTVGLRFPSHPIAKRLIELAGVPIAAPSANSSTRPSTTSAQHVYDDLCGKIGLIIDGGDCDVGVESTVVTCVQDPPVVLRPGGVTLEALQAVIPQTVAYVSHSNAAMELHPPTPGMKYRHYAPAVETVVVCGDPANVRQFLVNCINAEPCRRIGVILASHLSVPASDRITVLQNREGNNLQEYEYNLFRFLRALEKTSDIIYVEGVGVEHEGAAIMNRLAKAGSLVNV